MTRIDQLKSDLLNFYKNEGLTLIGGVQDKNKANNIQLLFYKNERRGQID